MNNIQMKSASNSCPRCLGSGKLPFRRSGGVCFRCNGAGFISTLTVAEKMEISDAIDFYRSSRPAPVEAVAIAPATEADENWFWNLFA